MGIAERAQRRANSSPSEQRDWELGKRLMHEFKDAGTLDVISEDRTARIVQAAQDVGMDSAEAVQYAQSVNKMTQLLSLKENNFADLRRAVREVMGSPQSP